MIPKSPYFTILPGAAIWVLELRLPAEVDISIFNDLTSDLVDHFPFARGAAVIADLSHNSYLGSVLLGLLLNLRQKTRESGGRLAVAALSTRLLQMVRTANIDRLLELYSNRDDAADALAG